MRLNKRHWIRGGTAAVAALLAAVVVAQERPRPTAPADGQKPQRITVHRPVEGAQSADRTIAECLAISNQEQVALATLAAEKTQNPKVKQFAETMIKDHGQLLSQLQQFGGTSVAFSLDRQGHAEPGARPDAPRAADRVAGRPPVAEHRTAFTPQGGLDFSNLKRQMAEKCIQTAQKNWAEKKGNDADMCFVGSQTVLHQQMVNGLEVLRPYASPQLQGVIDQGISTTQAHLAHAEKLLKELVDRGSSAAGQQRPSS
jgi:predicted outer membrane protein